jgi:ribosomal protein S2
MAKELERMDLKFHGIKDMEELPGLMFVLDIERDIFALKKPE